MIGIDPSLANALRRILISEVPTIVIEHVFIVDNTSIIAVSDDWWVCVTGGYVSGRGGAEGALGGVYLLAAWQGGGVSWFFGECGASWHVDAGGAAGVMWECH